MPRSAVVQLLAVTLSVALIVGSSAMIPSINQTRSNLNILGNEDALKNAPPEYAFAIQAFGAFRSLITNIAFIRAENYKNEGRYYDAFELAEWICKLQPYFPVVWEFHGWNMAWNISVTTFTPEERWHWVYNGVKLIRDQGVRRNPRAVNLYKQLAWTLFNKMGGDIDEFHMTYKKKWAWRMHLLMGPPPPPLAGDVSDELLRETLFSAEEDAFYQASTTQEVLTRERMKKDALERLEDAPEWDPNETRERAPSDEMARIDEMRNDRDVLRRAAMISMLKEIAAAEHSLEQLYAAEPDAQSMVNDLWALGIRISDNTIDEAAFLKNDGLGLRFFLPYRELTTPGMIERFRDESTRVPTEDDTRQRIGEILGVAEDNPAGLALVRFLQRKILLEAYNTDPEHMLAITRQFGAMDWRLAETHAIYWVTQAIILSEGTEGSFENDKTNTFRILLFSMQSLARRNHLFFDPLPGNVNLSYLNMLPDPAFIETMNMTYMRYAPRFDWRDPDSGPAGDLFRSGHVNFLEENVRTLYFAGREEAAQEYYDFLRTEYGTHHSDGALKERYTLPLEDFAILGIRENASLKRDMIRVIRGLQTQALHRYSTGDLEYGSSSERLARRLHREWNADQAGVGSSRNLLPPFDEMYADAFRSFLSIPSQSFIHVLEKARIWPTAPLNIRQRVYDPIREQLANECAVFSFDVTKAFPEPEGMAEYREKFGTRTAQPEGEADESPAFTPKQPVNKK